VSTGWRYVFSDGEERKSQIYALLHLKENPDLRVVFSELTMAGTKETDVTERLRSVLASAPQYGETP
jgi:hypothetical protein